jgi:hypothetical protein
MAHRIGRSFLAVLACAENRKSVTGMPARLAAVLALLLGLVISLPHAASAGQAAGQRANQVLTSHTLSTRAHAPDRLIAKFRSGARHSAREQALSRAGARELRAGRRSGVSVLRVDKNGPGIPAAIKRLQESGLFEYVEPDYQVQALTTTPNDPALGQLWGLSAIQAPEAWDLATGAPPVVVGIIDTGVDYTHEDLADNVWRNPGEAPVPNGIDDDGNGYVDDIHGINAIAGNGDPFDDHSHGTHVAGTIGAVGDNGVGVVGVNWAVQVMALKFLDANGWGNVSDAIECLEYAILMKEQYGVNLKLTNNSWGGGGFSQGLADAIAASGDAGMLFVAAAGNYSTDNDAVPSYPASYGSPNVVAVAASDPADRLTYFSHYGAESVDLAAPGIDILSSIPGNGYAFFNGTSMAAPHVSGAAALLWAVEPDADPLAIKANLLATVDPTPELEGRVVSGGCLNAFNAMSACSANEPVMSVTPRDGFAINTGEALPIEIALFRCASRITNATVTVDVSEGGPPIFVRDDGVAPDETADDGRYAAAWVANRAGPVSLVISAIFAGGSLADTVDGTVVDMPEYRFEPGEFAWIDASAGGQVPVVYDDQAVELDLGFEFPFYGELHDRVAVSTNGLLSFGIGAEEYANSPLPSPSLPNQVIAPYWDDFNPSQGGSVFALAQGSAPNRSLTIEWNDLPYWSGGGSATFQATLHEDGRIQFQYQDVDSGYLLNDFGISATVGIEDVTGTHGLQYAFDQPLIEDAMSLWIVVGADSCDPAGDTDGDGVCDSADNCLEEPNADQIDSNLDGYGNACDPDYDDDGVVSIPDFRMFRPHLGSSSGDASFDPSFDHDGDGAVGIPDFAMLRHYFGERPGPSGLSCAGTIPCETP